MLQLVMAIVGIVVLVKGTLKLSANKVVEGTPARVLGAMLLMPLPVAFGIGLGLGAYVTMRGGNVEDYQIPMLMLDVGIVVFTALLVFGLAMYLGKPPGAQKADKFPPYPPGPLPPSDPSNPYQSPFTR